MCNAPVLKPVGKDSPKESCASHSIEGDTLNDVTVA